MSEPTPHATIYLTPPCCGNYEHGEATWCEDAANECGNCGAPPTEYVTRARLDAITAERYALLAANEWRDIASAPMDGASVLLCDASGFQCVGRWDEAFNSEWCDEINDLKYSGAWTADRVGSFNYEEYAEEHPTHWRPIPPPPASDGEA